MIKADQWYNVASSSTVPSSTNVRVNFSVYQVEFYVGIDWGSAIITLLSSNIASTLRMSLRIRNVGGIYYADLKMDTSFDTTLSAALYEGSGWTLEQINTSVAGQTLCVIDDISEYVQGPWTEECLLEIDENGYAYVKEARTLRANNIIVDNNIVAKGQVAAQTAATTAAPSQGVSDYAQLSNKPQIDGRELQAGNNEWGLLTRDDLEGLIPVDIEPRLTVIEGWFYYDGQVLATDHIVRFNSAVMGGDKAQPKTLDWYGDIYGNNLRPQSNEAYDLGSANLKWNNLYVKNINIDALQVLSMQTEELTADSATIAALTAPAVTTDTIKAGSSGKVTVNNTTHFIASVQGGSQNKNTLLDWYGNIWGYDIRPQSKDTYNLGAASNKWLGVYAQQAYVDTLSIGEALIAWDADNKCVKINGRLVVSGQIASTASGTTADNSVLQVDTILTQHADQTFNEIILDDKEQSDIPLLSNEVIIASPLYKYTRIDRENKREYIGTSAQYWQAYLPELISSHNDRLGIDSATLALVVGKSNATELASIRASVADNLARIINLEKIVNK